MATATATRQEGIFLPGLARAFEGIDVQGDLATLQFAQACEAILPVFDRLGPVFAYAKSELIIKRDSLEQAATRLPTLTAVVAADKKLLRNLSADSACTLHTAAANAYNGTMSPIHNFFVRTAVKTSMYTLPTRAGFLESIGETEASARVHSAKFIPASTLVVRKAEALFGGTSMPKSDSTWTG